MESDLFLGACFVGIVASLLLWQIGMMARKREARAAPAAVASNELQRHQ